MVGQLFDTCILIDYLRGITEARDEVAACVERPAISIISRIELLAGAPESAKEATNSLLARFDILPLDDTAADRTVAIRQSQRLKLPDAVILATAQASGLILVTRDERAFGPEKPGIRIPYRL